MLLGVGRVLVGVFVYCNHLILTLRPKQPNKNSSLKRPSLFLINTLGNLWLLENKMLSELRVKYTFLCMSGVAVLKWVCSEPRLQACSAAHTPHFLVATPRAAGGIRGL